VGACVLPGPTSQWWSVGGVGGSSRPPSSGRRSVGGASGRRWRTVGEITLLGSGDGGGRRDAGVRSCLGANKGSVRFSFDGVDGKWDEGRN
jgi:hypothetical protein